MNEPGIVEVIDPLTDIFSNILSGFVVLGMTLIPHWRIQETMIWVGGSPYFEATPRRSSFCIKMGLYCPWIVVSQQVFPVKPKGRTERGVSGNVNTAIFTVFLKIFLRQTRMYLYLIHRRYDWALREKDVEQFDTEIRYPNSSDFA